MIDIEEKLKILPENSGVYIMLDENQHVIYVGKARILKNRVRQYFHSTHKSEKVAQMVQHIHDFYYIITKTELDALILENNLIKKYKPKYNILLKDDKSYPYIAVDLTEDYPSFTITRTLKKGKRYFGPYMAGVRVKEILDILSVAFEVRTCKIEITKKTKRACLLYHIHRCLAPCAHYTTHEAYIQRVKEAIAFLEGEGRQVQKGLQEKMLLYAQQEEFELALECKERLAMLENLSSKRITTLGRDVSFDVLAYVSNHLYAAINILMVRHGIMQGSATFAVENASDDTEALTSFITQYYTRHELPKELIVQDFCESTLLQKYLTDLGKGQRIITIPKIGIKKQLLDMSFENANNYLLSNLEKLKHKEDRTIHACERLQQILALKRYPKRMECYDISNISGVDKVGSMVVFDNGEPDKKSYRRFKIKTVEGANDFASLQEVLKRRLSKLGTIEESKFPKPDLIIIDGGKGQLSSVQEIFKAMQIDDIELISLAKREEEIFTIYSKESIQLSKRDYCLQMLQHIRDEAHRFAITFFRNIHNKKSLKSILEEVHGLGKVKIEQLLQTFGNIDKILKATPEELASVDGIGQHLAIIIKKHLEEKL